MKSLAITSMVIVAVLTGGSRAAGLLDSTSSSAGTALGAASAGYLGKESDLIDRMVLRPNAAIVLLSEPCGAQQGYSRARLFGYEPASNAPTAEHDGCYRRKEAKLGPKGTITLYASDGTAIGAPILHVPAAEAFEPRYFFLPSGHDPPHTQLRIEAVAVASSRDASGTRYSPVGLTRQRCPVENTWLLARRMAKGRAGVQEACWEERGNSIGVRDITYSDNAPPRLSASEGWVDKATFFAAATLATTPVKYRWPPR